MVSQQLNEYTLPNYSKSESPSTDVNIPLLSENGNDLRENRVKLKLKRKKSHRETARGASQRS